MRQDCRVGGTTTPANGATAPVEKRQVDAMLPRDFGELLLRAILRPRRRQLASILGGVGVADHHLLPVATPTAIPSQRQQLLQAVAGMVEVVQRLKQGDDRQCLLQTAGAQQQDDGQHIRGITSHRDHVVADAGVAWVCSLVAVSWPAVPCTCLGNNSAGRQHFLCLL